VIGFALMEAFRLAFAERQMTLGTNRAGGFWHVELDAAACRQVGRNVPRSLPRSRAAGVIIVRGPTVIF
jgi:hypothetical protein